MLLGEGVLPLSLVHLCCASKWRRSVKTKSSTLSLLLSFVCVLHVECVVSLETASVACSGASGRLVNRSALLMRAHVRWRFWAVAGFGDQTGMLRGPGDSLT